MSNPREVRLSLEYAEEALRRSIENSQHHANQLTRQLREKRHWEREVKLLRRRLAEAERDQVALS
ncbi:MAG: hypothetical protein AB7G28_26395 [Pirellulales bacterium]